MKYDFQCEDCSHTWEVTMKANDFKEIKEEGLECVECGSVGYNTFNPGDLEVCYKGFQWADKNFKEKAYRKDRAKYMEKRQNKNNFTPKLAPNYKGERTGSWKEAQEAARKDGKFAETYEPLVQKEQRKS